MAHGYNVLLIQRTNRRSPQVYVVTRFDCIKKPPTYGQDSKKIVFLDHVCNGAILLILLSCTHRSMSVEWAQPDY